MKLKKVLIAIIISIVMAIQIYGEGESLFYKDEIIKSSQYITKEKYINANYAIVKKSEKINYDKDGKYSSVTDVYIKILDEIGRSQNSRVEYGYDKNYGTASLDLLEVIDKEGNKRTVDIKANSKEEISTEGVYSNIYDDSGVDITVQIPELYIGEIVHYVISEKIEKARIEGEFSNFTVAEYTQPILDYRVEIKAPKEKPLKKSVVLGGKNGAYTLDTKEESDGNLYSFEVKNVDQLYLEPSMPPYLNVAMRWLVSTEENWEEVSKWYYNLCEPKIIINEKIKAKTEELIKDKNSEKEKIKEIFYFVSRKIRYTGLTNEDNRPGLEPHSTDYTFDTMTGVCRDKAALITAMLRSAGMESYMVLMNASRRLDEEVPLTYFNHAISCAVTKSGEIVLMDPTDETTNELLPYYLMDKSYLLAKKDGDILRATTVRDGKENLLKVSTTAEIKGNKMVCRSRIEFYGINDNGYRGSFSEMNKQEIENFIESLVKRMSQSGKLISYKILPEELLNSGENLIIEMEYEAGEMVIGEKYQIINIPRFSRMIGVYNSAFAGAGLTSRKYPYKLRYTSAIDEEVKVRLEKNMKIESLPEIIDIKNQKYEYKMEYGRDGEFLVYKNSSSFNALEFSPEEYLKMKADFRLMENSIKKRVIVTTKRSIWRFD